MPRPSNETLMKRLNECVTDLATVSRDDAYSGQNIVLTYKALRVFLKRETKHVSFIAVLRINNFTPYCQKYGYDMLFGAIRRVVNVRAPQVLHRSRVPADNDILFVLEDSPEDLKTKILPMAKTEGLKVSIAYVPYSGLVDYDYHRAVEAFQTITAR